MQITAQEYKQLANPKKHKYNAKQTTIDGFKFHSKKEADYYRKLKDQREKGEISRFHPQITFLLPGGIKHHVDFQVITKCVYYPPLHPQAPDFLQRIDYEKIEYIEVKGRDNPIGKLKRKQCEELYGIEIKIV